MKIESPNKYRARENCSREAGRIISSSAKARLLCDAEIMQHVRLLLFAECVTRIEAQNTSTGVYPPQANAVAATAAIFLNSSL